MNVCFKKTQQVMYISLQMKFHLVLVDKVQLEDKANF